MDTDLLRAFVAVADTGGFSAAANLLNRTQSAVSLQVKRLEEQFDTKLFARTSRSVTLTAGGRTMLPYARQLLHLEEHAHATLSQNRDKQSLRVGLTEEHATAHLPQVLSKFAQVHPDVRLDISCEVSPVLVDRFLDGALDVVLAVRHRPTKTGRLIGVERLIWVGREGFELPVGGPLPLALNPEGCIFRDHALAAMGRVGRQWREPYLSTSPTGVNVPVQMGLAVTVKTPRSLPPGCLDIGEALALPELGMAEIEIHASPAQIGDAFELLVAEIERVAAHKHG